ncbi:tRNA 2-selenouridine(34) synthase MnmH [Lacibacter sp. MH-610]|uniref:tRNA 2-selenouridine(34) synthase MnmH n=1 Tax=Lacibacter sp. MH-610 TaxID=3020883 RepID=UPI003892B0F6
MAVTKIHIEEFLQLAQQHPVLDVRSPGEYKHAHIPGAVSFPLFTDEERKVVGTAYKQKSREEAIKIGLDYFGVKMRKMVEEAEDIVGRVPLADNRNTDNVQPPTKTILIHCWRGGMRSAGVAWLLDLYGFKVYTLIGGYKLFRRWVLEQFEKNYSFKVVGGFTGSGKSYVLKALEQNGQTVIDLETLAHHKGSAFGNIGMPPQPSQELFENKLALELHRKANRCIWVEDESQRIGDVNIPIVLWKQWRQQPLYFLDIPFEERLKHITEEYGKLERERLVNSIIRIKKRLGGLETKESINALIEDRVEDCFRILLRYYDKWYLKGMNNREQLETLLQKIPCESVTISNYQKLL